MMKVPPTLILLLPLIACAPTTEWARANTTPAQIAAEQKACDDLAAYRALDESFASGPKYPPLRDTQFTIDGGDGEGSGGPVASYSRRGARQYELSVYCMEQRGYHLVPVRKS
jgi:hypothetical protein